MSDIRFNRWLHQSGTGGVYQDSSGRVGIGTSVPTSALDVQSGTIKIGSNTLSSSGVSTFTNIVVSAGSTSAPSISPTGDSNTGIFFPAPDTIVIGEGGTEVLRVDSNGRVGINTISPVKTLDVGGEATFGAGITISDLSWGKDTNQLVYTFSGTASGVNPADGVVALVSPNANPSASRVGSLVFGNKVSGTSVTGNPGLKGGIDCTTNTNVANAADTGGYLNFYTKPDNANYRSQMTLNSNGVLTRPYQPAFLAYSTAVAVSGGWNNLSASLTAEAYDIAGNYGTSTAGRFVAPVAGRYLFYFGGWSTGNTIDARYAVSAIVNGGSQSFIAGGNYSTADSPLSGYSVVHNLSANDYVELVYYSAIATQWGGSTHWVYWGGYLL
jgi:hypothetical protein